MLYRRCIECLIARAALPGVLVFSLHPICAAAATSITASISVSAEVPAPPGVCSMTATGLTLVAGGATRAGETAKIAVVCTGSAPYTVGLDAAPETDAGAPPSEATDVADAARVYPEYRDVVRTVSWSGGAITDQRVSSDAGPILTVNGRVVLQQPRPTGARMGKITAFVIY